VTISWGADEIAIYGDLLALLENAQDLTDCARAEPLALGPAPNVGSGDAPVSRVALDDLQHHVRRRNGRRAWPSLVRSGRHRLDFHLGQQRLVAVDAYAHGVRTPRCAANRVLAPDPCSLLRRADIPGPALSAKRSGKP